MESMKVYRKYVNEKVFREKDVEWFAVPNVCRRAKRCRAQTRGAKADARQGRTKSKVVLRPGCD